MTNTIPVHRLTHETWIMAPSGPARAIDIRFDGSGYGIDLRYGQSDDGYEEYMYVDAGGSVEFAGVGEPKLRGEQYITFEEWQALYEVALAKLDASMAAFALPVDAPVNLLDAVRQFRTDAAAAPISHATLTDFLCAMVAASTSPDSVREGSDNQMEAV